MMGLQQFFFQSLKYSSNDFWAVEQCIKSCKSTYFEPFSSFRNSLLSFSTSDPSLLSLPEQIVNCKPVWPTGVCSLALGVWFLKVF
jgi:hypothetical protein